MICVVILSMFVVCWWCECVIWMLCECGWGVGGVCVVGRCGGRGWLEFSRGFAGRAGRGASAARGRGVWGGVGERERGVGECVWDVWWCDVVCGCEDWWCCDVWFTTRRGRRMRSRWMTRLSWASRARERMCRLWWCGRCSNKCSKCSSSRMVYKILRMRSWVCLSGFVSTWRMRRVEVFSIRSSVARRRCDGWFIFCVDEWRIILCCLGSLGLVRWLLLRVWCNVLLMMTCRRRCEGRSFSKSISASSARGVKCLVNLKSVWWLLCKKLWMWWLRDWWCCLLMIFIIFVWCCWWIITESRFLNSFSGEVCFGASARRRRISLRRLLNKMLC